VTEISVDETFTAQTPVELLLILAMIQIEGIPVQTIAPKFTGRFLERHIKPIFGYAIQVGSRRCKNPQTTRPD
jgi:hypothetical protein